MLTLPLPDTLNIALAVQTPVGRLERAVTITFSHAVTYDRSRLVLWPDDESQ